MQIDIHKLREMTERVRQDQQMDELSLAAKQAEVTAKIKKHEEEAAARTLANVPNWCELAAGKGKNCAVIYKSSNYDEAHFLHGDPPKDRMTAFPLDDRTENGLAVCRKLTLIYEGLKEAGLNPYFRYGHDGIGEKSWFDLVARW